MEPPWAPTEVKAPWSLLVLSFVLLLVWSLLVLSFVLLLVCHWICLTIALQFHVI